MSEKLRKAFGREEVKGERRIYIKFPERDEHKGHEVYSVSKSQVRQFFHEMEVYVAILWQLTLFPLGYFEDLSPLGGGGADLAPPLRSRQLMDRLTRKLAQS